MIRQPTRRLWLPVVIGAVVAIGLASDELADRSAHAATSAPFLDQALGAPRSDAALVTNPSRGVTVRLHADGYSVTKRGQGTIELAGAGPATPWSRFTRGVRRRTTFGSETIAVGPDRTEEFLTVARHQGTRTWRWKVRTSTFGVRASGSGAVSLSVPGTAPVLEIAPVRILDAAGVARTPPGARWTVRRAGAHSWWLELRLDDRRLPLPYVIDPAVDYPSPLYLSSTASTESGSWRLVTTAPSAANSATTTTPAANAAGYYLFKPGTGNTSPGTPSSTEAGTGFVQDLAGGTGIPAGSWSFSVKTQIPGSTLVTGSAVLSIGLWKGTISGKAFRSTQTILTPTDDPAAQNIRTSLSAVTTTVTYSLPAFNLASNERLYVDIWRKQVSGINSATAADRQVNLIVNDGGSRIVHPAADDTVPVHAFQAVNSTGGVYFTAPGGSSGTVYYRGSAAGSFKLQDLATDSGSGVAQVTYPAVTKAGWTHAAETVTSAPSYQSSTYSWTAGATSSPGAQAIVAQDLASNSSTGTITITNDTTAPTTSSVALTSPPAWYTTPSVALTPTDGTDAGSGVDATSRVYKRDETTMTNGACNAFPGTWATVVSNPDATVQNGRCYRYELVESDRVGNQSAASAASATAKVDLQPPTQPSLAFSALTNAVASGSTLYYRPGTSGNFTVTASSSDAESGVSVYVFPTPATWTVTGTGAARTYAWSGTPTPPGTLGAHARDVAGNTGPDAQFVPTPDSTPPSTTDNSAVIGSNWTTTTQTVTLTSGDGLSGVAQTYFTTDGSTPTTSSPTGTSITLAADGSYTVKYFSVDKVGNAEPVQTASTAIRIDKTPPTATLGTLPSTVRNGQVLTAAASDAASGVASVSYYMCSPSPCTPAALIGSSSGGPGYSVTWSSQPADGSYDVSARVLDNAGNTGNSAKTTVTVDNGAPTTTITAQPTNPIQQRLAELCVRLLRSRVVVPVQFGRRGICCLRLSRCAVGPRRRAAHVLRPCDRRGRQHRSDASVLQLDRRHRRAGHDDHRGADGSLCRPLAQLLVHLVQARLDVRVQARRRGVHRMHVADDALGHRRRRAYVLGPRNGHCWQHRPHPGDLQLERSGGARDDDRDRTLGSLRQHLAELLVRLVGAGIVVPVPARCWDLCRLLLAEHAVRACRWLPHVLGPGDERGGHCGSDARDLRLDSRHCGPGHDDHGRARQRLERRRPVVRVHVE